MHIVTHAMHTETVVSVTAHAALRPGLMQEPQGHSGAELGAHVAGAHSLQTHHSSRQEGRCQSCPPCPHPSRCRHVAEVCAPVPSQEEGGCACPVWKALECITGANGTEAVAVTSCVRLTAAFGVFWLLHLPSTLKGA